MVWNEVSSAGYGVSSGSSFLRRTERDSQMFEAGIEWGDEEIQTWQRASRPATPPQSSPAHPRNVRERGQDRAIGSLNPSLRLRLTLGHS